MDLIFNGLGRPDLQLGNMFDDVHLKEFTGETHAGWYTFPVRSGSRNVYRE